MSKNAALRRFRARQNCATMLSQVRRLAVIGVILAAGMAAQPASASAPLPSGATVAAGSARVDTGANSVTVNQSSTRAVINWTGFSVSAGNSVVFNQPDAQSATLNRVTGRATSTIAGQITSNGGVYLVNPNGIVITASGTIDTRGGFVASTLGITDADFMAGNLAFAGRGASATVSNRGRITTGAGGFVALLGGAVANAGQITVPLGKVGLGSGERIALDLNGGNFLQVAVPTRLLVGGALVSNSGTISASGGSVTLSAATARNIVRNVINMSGAISADSAISDGGVIRLLGGDGGTVTASGTLSARATGAGGNGGIVETSGANVNFAGATVNTMAANGKAGSWIIDPSDLNIDQTAANTISNNLLTTNVTLTTFDDGQPGAGDININGVINWNSNNDLTLLSFNDVNLNSAIHWTGDGVGRSGNFTIEAGRDINFNAPLDWNKGFGLFFNAFRNINVVAPLSSTTNTFLQFTSDKTGTGTGTITFGATRTSTGSLNTGGAVVNLFYNPTSYATPTDFSQVIPAFSAGSGTFLFPYMLVNTATDLQNVSTNLSGYYGMVRDIDATATATLNSGAGFAPLGVDANGTVLGGGAGFTGLFYGQGHVIDRLTINRPGVSNIGLFGYASGMVSGLTLSNVAITGGANTGAVAGTLDNTVGGVCNCGPNSINRAFVTGTVTGANNTGGIVGYVNGGAGVDASSLLGATVSGNNGVGGVVGTLMNGYATNDFSDEQSVISGNPNVGGIVGAMGAGTVTNASSTARVIGTNGTGGIIGSAFGGTISNSLANGTVNGVANVGGFVGVITDGVTIDASSSTATVTGNAQTSAAVGGFVGALNGGGTISNSQSSGNVSGASFVGGFAGVLNAGTTGSITRSSAFRTGNAGTVTGGDYTGGFVGIAGGAILTDDVVGNSTGAQPAGPTVSGNNNVGGFVGLADVGTAILRATSNVTVSGAGSVGGIAGQLIGSSTIAASTAYGPVTGSSIVVGGLVGYLNNGSVTNSIAYGAVTGFAYVGGIVGNINGGTVSLSTATGAVSGSDLDNSYWIGGLVGNASGATIADSSATGAVRGNAQIGGLVGYLNTDSSIARSGASGSVTGTGSVNANFDIGGLVGFSAGSISQSTASGAVRGFEYVGGLVGWLDDAGTISGSRADGTVTGVTVPGATGFATTGNGNGRPFQFDHTYDIGGFAGLVRGTVIAGDQSGSVSADAGSQNVGGLAGEAAHAITASQSRAASVIGGSSVGGLIGTVDNVTIDGSTAIAAVSGNTDVGGLIGTSDGTISNSSASGAVSGSNSVGGLLGTGTINSLVTKSFATGNVAQGAGTGAGGLVGYDYGAITLSYATGNVSGGNGSNSLGGLVGVLNGSQGGGTLSDAYATGAVTGENIVGGLVGGNTGSITRTYAVGAVSGTTKVGGLVGWNLTSGASLTSSYWDTTTTGQASGFGQNDGTFTGIGRTTAQMLDLNAFQSNYTGFDFNAVWSPPNQAGQGDPIAHYPQLYALSLVVWVRPNAATSVYGSNQPALSFSTSGLRNGDGLATNPTLSTIVGPTSNVGSYVITQTGAQPAGSYRLVLTNGTYTVTPRPLILTANPLSRLYGGANPTSATATADVSANSLLVNGDRVDSVSVTSPAIASSGVGTYALDASNAVFGVGLASNYAITYRTNPTGLTITPAPLLVTYTANAATRLYGQSNPPLSGSVLASGLVNNETLSNVISGTAVFTTTATTTSNVGQYAITGSGLSAASANYSFNFAQAPGNATALTINPAPLSTVVVTASLVGSASKTYDGTRIATLNPANFQLAGFVNGEGATVTKTTGTYATANAGTGILVTTTLAQGDFLANNGTNLGNYLLPTSASGTIGTILRAPLTILYVADSLRRTYGQSNPPLSGSVIATGLAATDSLARVTTGTAVFSTTASRTSNVGTYASNGSGLIGSSGNYTYSFGQAVGNASALTITPASLIVYYTANAVTRTAGSPVGTLTGSQLAIGLVNGDTLSSVTSGTAVFRTTATASSGPGLYAITGSGLVGFSANYAIRFLQSPSNSFAYSVLPPTRSGRSPI